MKKIIAVVAATMLLTLAVGCGRTEKYDPEMKDAKTQQKDAKEMWKDVEQTPQQ